MSGPCLLLGSEVVEREVARLLALAEDELRGRRRASRGACGGESEDG